MTELALPDRDMTKAETAKLLALIAAYDNRTVGDVDVNAWHLVAGQAHWSLPHAMRAVVEFHAASTDWIRAGHITAAITERRNRYAKTYAHEQYPAGMTDPGEQVAWERSRRSAWIVRCMDRWAAGEDR